MNVPPDTTAPDWARPWAAALTQREIRFSARVRSNPVNAVFRLGFDDGDRFLKVGPSLEDEYRRLQWLVGRLPAPRPIGLTTREGTDALLMTAVAGSDLAELSESLPPTVIVARLAAALRTVHAVGIADWPFGGTGTVLVHGDACLPNFLYHGDALCGCIDVGDMAVGEPDVDLAAAIWSLQRNLGPGYGLRFLHEYGVVGANEEDVERLRQRYGPILRRPDGRTEMKATGKRLLTVQRRSAIAAPWPGVGSGLTDHFT